MRVVWRYPDFRWVALGQGLSWLGDGFVAVALAVAVLGSGGSVTDLGIPLGASMAGRLVFLLLGGVWADRLPPTAIMVASDVIRAGLALALAAMFASDHWNVWALAVIFGLFGAVGAFFMPAVMTLKPRLVPPTERQSANAALTVIQTSTGIAGPVLAGGVVAIAGAPTGFIIDAVSFVLSALCVRLVAVRPERTARGSFVSDLHGGLRAVTERAWISATILSALLYHVGNGAALVLIQVVAMKQLGGAHAVGLVESSIAAGSLAGGLIGARVRSRRPLIAGCGFLLLTPLGMLPVAWPLPLPAVIAGLATGFGALMIYSVLYETALQNNIPEHLYARVTSWDMLGSWAIIPLSSAMAGVLAGAFGVSEVMVGCIALMCVASLLPLLVPDVWRVRARVPAVAPTGADDP